MADEPLGEIRNVSTPEDTAANVIRLRVDWPTGQTDAERAETVRMAAFFEPFVGPVEYGGDVFAADVRDPDWRETEWRPLRWERPRIVSTGSTAAGTPKPNGWEA